MLLITLVFIAISLLIVGYTFKRPAMAFGAGVMWFIASIQAWVSSTAAWDVYYGVFVFGIIMLLVSIIEGWALRPDKKDEPPELTDAGVRETQEYIERRDTFRDGMNTMGGRRPRRRVVRKKKSKTGDIDEETGDIS